MRERRKDAYKINAQEKFG